MDEATWAEYRDAINDHQLTTLPPLLLLRRQLQPQHTLPAHRQPALLLEPAVDGAGLPCRARALADGAGVAADGVDAVRARGVREGRVPTAHVHHHSPAGGHARVDVVRHALARQILAALAVPGPSAPPSGAEAGMVRVGLVKMSVATQEGPLEGALWWARQPVRARDASAGRAAASLSRLLRKTRTESRTHVAPPSTAVSKSEVSTLIRRSRGNGQPLNGVPPNRPVSLRHHIRDQVHRKNCPQVGDAAHRCQLM